MPHTNFTYAALPLNLSINGLPVIPSAGFGGVGPSTSLNALQGSNVYFVNSAVTGAMDAKGKGVAPGAPFKTLNFALTQCVNNNGDIIFVGPQHVETIATAAALTFPTTNAAGVTVVGLGNETDRATINFTATAGTVTIPATNVTLVGLLFTNAIDALVSGVSVTGSDLKVVGCEWRDGSATNTLIGWITTAAAKRLSFFGYRYYQSYTSLS